MEQIGLKQKDKYTKDELTLKSGIHYLAAAVIKQWVLDNKPKQDIESIEVWKKILETTALDKKPYYDIDLE